MENERFQELLTRVANLNWVTPDWAEAFCAVYPSYAYFHCNSYYPLATDEMTPAEYDEYQKRLREFISEPRAAAYDDYLKRLREFILALRRDFPEWHFHSYELHRREGFTYKCAGDFVADFRRLQDDLRRVWELVLRKEMDEAMRSLLQIKIWFSGYLNNLERQQPRSNSWEHDKRAVELMVETLAWLQKKLRKLKVCENPKCRWRKYFFKYNNSNNQRYCHTKCGAKAKALRNALRAPKEYKLSEETREKMSIAMQKSWAKRKRAERRKGSSPPESPPHDADRR